VIYTIYSLHYANCQSFEIIDIEQLYILKLCGVVFPRFK